MQILRAALYERVSTEEQALHGFSINAQIDNLTEYCIQHDLKIVDHYTDDGISGAKPPLKRPALKRLLDDVACGKIDIILFTRLDRWFRSVKEYYNVQEILDKFHVQWKAIYENYDTSTANGQMAITIFLAVAQNERDRTAERIKTVFEHKRKNKEACFGGSVAPLGYMKKEDENGIVRLVKDPETQNAAQDFWDILVSYNNLNKAIRHMENAYGIKKNWKSWKHMLQSDFYSGVHKGIENFCEPYVSPADFERINTRPTIKATRTGNIYIFRGLMRCPACGSILCGSSLTRGEAVYKSYCCPCRSRTCSNFTYLSERKLEAELLDRIDGFILDEIAAAEIEQAKPKPKPKTNIQMLKEKQRRLTVAYMAGNIADSDYLQQDAELKDLIKKAKEIEPPPPRDLTPLKNLLKTDFRALYKTFNDEEKQRFWRSLIKEMKIRGRHIDKIIFF